MIRNKITNKLINKIMIHILDLEFLGLNQAIAAFLVETSEGPVLVETGSHSVSNKYMLDI